MIKKILIANRGEIAIRIIRASKELGIKTVAVYSKADKDSLHTWLADEDVCIGEYPPYASYLDPRRIISAAIITNSDAIHPGYGFLAEDPDFAEMCESHNILFIGPSSKMIQQMGNKSEAKSIMSRSDVPIIPGSNGLVGDIEQAKELARQIGYPLMIKAVAGGGGRGMRLVRDETTLENAFETARSEAKVAFGNDGVYIERFIENPRHIEVQLIGDGQQNVLHLGERECSIQRRHQKLVEESPSPAVTKEIRKKLTEAAVAGAKAINYKNAGTMEFLLDQDGNFYFMEMNTRIQVEHAVTEMVVGLDIVKMQLRIASGERLAISQNDVHISGHAIECRINAEDPDNNFTPSPGKITNFHIPGGLGIRVDTHAYSGYTIPPYYDSMIAKLIAYGNTRDEAIARMRRALDEFIVKGVKTTIPLHKRIMDDERFRRGEIDTSFLDELL